MSEPKTVVYENFGSQSPCRVIEDPTEPTWDDVLSETPGIDPQDDDQAREKSSMTW